MNYNNIIEKKHRLPREHYIGKKIIAFTGNIKYRKPLFESYKTFICIEEILLKELNVHNCSAYIYLFMPDHFHFILAGKNKESNIKKCIDSFKQKSGFWLYKNMPAYKWQKDYYDHIIKNYKDLIHQIDYIKNNPVRAGIVNDWKKYKLIGSSVFELDELE